MKKQKKLFRLADMILGVVCELKKQHLLQIQSNMKKFCEKCDETRKDSNLFDMAIEKNWLNSAEKIKSRTNRNLNDLTYHLQQFKGLLSTDRPKEPKISDVLAELNQIDAEFGVYEFDMDEKTISVITDPIGLDDIAFGSFEIKLYLKEMSRLYKDSPYRVIALEPNPAGANSEVTHPHVSSEKLCEGDGYMPIRKSLEEGRLCDFFTMIVNILQTYNPDSPYISLDDWEGISCYDCGYTVSGDECYYCEYCERDYCSNCSSYCRICDTTVCLGCAYECPACNQPVCKDCTAVCSECEDTFCKDCLTEDGLCENCEENRKEQNHEEQENKSETAETCPAIQSDSVGETIVLSGHNG